MEKVTKKTIQNYILGHRLEKKIIFKGFYKNKIKIFLK